MHRVLLILSSIRKHKNTIILIAVLVVFAIFIIMAFQEINRLQKDIELYESQIAFLSDKKAEYESALKQNEELILQITRLQANGKGLEEKIGSLQDSCVKLAAEVVELERLNGELLKKFDGLSKLN